MIKFIKGLGKNIYTFADPQADKYKNYITETKYNLMIKV